jgi:carboxyl-terminal processing protease
MRGTRRARPYTRSYMRRRFPLNALVVAVAAASALVLTVVRTSPQSVVSFEFETPAVRAAPGEKVSAKHDLTALKIFNLTLVRVKERYVDPSRIDPRKMLYQALDSVQFNIPEVLVEPYPDRNEVAVMVNDKRQVFATDDVDSPWRLAAKLKKVFRFIESNINPGADLAEVEYAAVNGMLHTLDPHSLLMDPEQAREMDVSTSGKFGGLGIVIRMVDKKLTVIRPMKNTPAWKAGVKAGDHIAKINHESTENLTTNEAVDRMRGEPKTAVTLWVERKGSQGLMRFDLVRDVIHVENVEYKLLDKGIGLIRVKQFSSSIAAETARAMDEMIAQGAHGWILDLRWNPGGLLEQAVQLTDLFVDSGTIVTTVSGRDREPRRAERGAGDTGSPLIVLVNASSASASEIVAGALKNLDRAVVIGTRSFGKGSVQELYDNEDGSKLKLTVAQYLTPGDRSIQSLGIVPDISLQRMYVPPKNDAPGDLVRLLAPSRSWGEKDLDSHLTSTYAKDTDKPSYELSFVVDPQPVAAAAAADDEAVPGDEEPVDDEIREDFEIKLARDLASSGASGGRNGLVKAAKPLIAKRRADEEKKLVDALAKIGVDWSAPPASGPAAKLTLSVAAAGGPEIKAGDVVTLTGTVKNEGAGPANRVHARVQSDDYVFEDVELAFGKVLPGETRTFSARIQVPKDALDRVDRLTFEVREARGAVAAAPPLTLRVAAAARPVFSYAYQLVDDGNGDGLVQKREKYHLSVEVKNTGKGAAPEAAALVRNLSGDGVALTKSRVELGALAPGESRKLDFGFEVTRELREEEAVVELVVYDAVLGTQASEKIRRPLRPAAGAVAAATGLVVAKADDAAVHEGAAADAPVVAWAPRGARLSLLGTLCPWSTVSLDGGRVGFVASDQVAKASNPGGAPRLRWQSTPPTVSLRLPTLETAAASYRLSGAVSDETRVEDIQVFVANRAAKIDDRKVFYKSNRGAAKPTQLDFAADIPLWPGSNQVTVLARESADVRSVQTFFIYREAAQTAQVTTPKAP